LTFEFKPFKKSGTKIRRKDIKIGMLASLVNSVKKIIVLIEDNKLSKQKHPKPSLPDQERG
jgi:hypothetical protein